MVASVWSYGLVSKLIKEFCWLGGNTYGLVLVAGIDWCSNCCWTSKNRNYEEV